MTDTPGESPKALLSPAALAVVRPDAPKASRLAAARGEAPLGPADRLASLAVLAADRDPAVRQAARDRLARGTVEPLLEGVAPDTDPRILDILARARGTDPAVADRLLRHPRVPDTALARLAVARPAALHAAVQDRAIPRPHRARIAGAMARAEGAGENPAPVVASPAPEAGAPPGSPARPEVGAPPGSGSDLSDEEAEALVARLAAGADESQFDRALTEDSGEAVEEGPEKHESLYKQILEMNVSQKIQLAFKGNKEARGLLIKDPNKLVCGSVIKSPKVTETEIIAFANSRNISAEVFRLIAHSKDLMKLYAIRVALAGNPRVPNDIAMRCLNTLQEKDVATIAKSKNVSSAVATAARRMIAAKAERQKQKEQAAMGGGH